jgi:hypothetical protein
MVYNYISHTHTGPGIHPLNEKEGAARLGERLHLLVREWDSYYITTEPNQMYILGGLA